MGDLTDSDLALAKQAGVGQQTRDSSAVYQTPGVDPKQRWWHVLDNAFILPEYIAEVCLSPNTGKAACKVLPCCTAETVLIAASALC